MRVPYVRNAKQYKIIGRGGGQLDVVFQAGNRRHIGRGFGALGGFIGRTVLPFLKRIVLPKAKKVLRKHVLPSVGRSLREGVSDVIRGKNVKATAKKRAIEAGERVFNSLTGGNKRRKRGGRRKVRDLDIFN